MAVQNGWLWFWRVRPGKEIDPETMCEQLIHSGRPGDLEELPIDRIVDALEQEYPDLMCDRKNRLAEVDIEEEETAIAVYWSSKHFYFEFYGDAWRQMDHVVELMFKFDIPCYDANARTMLAVGNPPCYAGTPEEQAINAEFDKVMKEEQAKIEASNPDLKEQFKLKTAFLKSGGMKRAREEAIRRLQARERGEGK